MSSPNRRGGLAIVALGAAVLPSCSSAICNLDEQCDHSIIITGHVAQMPSTLLVRLCINGACSEATGPWPNVNPNGGADRCLQTPDGSAPAFSFCPEYGGAPTVSDYRPGVMRRRRGTAIRSSSL